MEIIDLSTPFNLTEVVQFNIEGDAQGVAMLGTYMYMANGTEGLEYNTQYKPPLRLPLQILAPQPQVNQFDCMFY